MKNNMPSVPESDSAFSFERTKRLRGLLILGVFLFHFCNFFPTEVRPDIGHTMVGAFFMLSGFGLLESFKRKKNYLDEFVGKKTARLLVPVWIAGIIVLIVNWTVYNNHLVLTENAYLYDVISGGVTTTGTWFVVELIILYMFFYLAFKYLKMKWAIVAVSLATFLLMVILSPQKYGMWYASGMMFPVGLIISYWKDKIESFVPPNTGYIDNRFNYPCIIDGKSQNDFVFKSIIWKSTVLICFAFYNSVLTYQKNWIQNLDLDLAAL